MFIYLVFCVSAHIEHADNGLAMLTKSNVKNVIAQHNTFCFFYTAKLYFPSLFL